MEEKSGRNAKKDQTSIWQLRGTHTYTHRIVWYIFYHLLLFHLIGCSTSPCASSSSSDSFWKYFCELCGVQISIWHFQSRKRFIPENEIKIKSFGLTILHSQFYNPTKTVPSMYDRVYGMCRSEGDERKTKWIPLTKKNPTIATAEPHVQHIAHFYSTWITRVNETNSSGEGKNAAK